MAKKKHSKQQPAQPTFNPYEEELQQYTKGEQDHLKIRKLEIKFRTDAQEQLWNLIDQKEITLISGPAGTGKSHIAILKSLELLQKYPSKYKKIIVSKPNVESGPSIGYLPGEINSKLEPYFYSSKYLFSKILGEQKTERMLERKHIEVLALGFLRGINLDNCIFVLEEAQNCDKKMIRTILTRIGDNCKFIIGGDTTQVDTKLDVEQTGLYIAMKRLEDIPQIGVFRFADSDIVRNPIISVILERLNGEFS